MSKKKIITYLKEKELTETQVRNIITKYGFNPEDLTNEDIQKKIDEEVEIYRKPQKKLIIKRKVVKKAAIKTSVDVDLETPQTDEEVKAPVSISETGNVATKTLSKKEKSSITEPMMVEATSSKENESIEKAALRTAKRKSKTEDNVSVIEAPLEKTEKQAETSVKAKKTEKINADNSSKTESAETKTYQSKNETAEAIDAEVENTLEQEDKKEGKNRTTFESNKRYTYKLSESSQTASTEHHKKRIFIRKNTPAPTTTRERPHYQNYQRTGQQQRPQNFFSSFSKGQKNSQTTTPVVENTFQKKKKYVEHKPEIKDRDEFNNKLNPILKKKRETEFAIPLEIEIPESISVSELARKMNIKANILIQKLFEMGNSVTINQMLDADTVEILLSDFNCKVKRTSIFDAVKIPIQDNIVPELKKRPPIVTVLGHVDHGKTTLLDRIRKTNVASTEVGGITQRIGAYKVKIKGEEIVFIDTPGHEAFTSMRARGASVTDIAILVVAADDGVMPQTVEALNHAKQAKVPIIVAMNKCDKPDVKTEKIMTDLTAYDILPQEWGGDTMFIPISALKGDGVDELLTAILLVAESLDLKADYNPKRWADGVVIESRLDKGRGIVATVLVKNGILKEKDFFIAGNYDGKVKIMTDENGVRLDKAYPSTPVEVIGFEQLPDAGCILQVVDSEKTARDIARKRRELEIYEKQKENAVNLANILTKINKGEVGELNLIIKADVQGMAEALKTSLEKLSVPKVKVNVILSSVGAITESDVNLAATAKAIIIGFNTKPTKEAQLIAERENIEIRRYSIIYDVIEDVKDAMLGLAAPKFREEIIGEVEIRQIFKIPSIGVVGGAFVTKGVITKDAQCRIFRDNTLIYTSKIGSLYRFENPVKEVKQGMECGITIEKYNDLHENDIIEIFKNVEEKQSFEELAAYQETENSDKANKIEKE